MFTIKRITFKQFIYTYNFKYLNDLQLDPVDEDTSIIRIYPEKDDSHEPDFWFEFGLYDFASDSFKWDICKKALSNDILSSYVEKITYDDTINKVVTVYLTKDNGE